MIQQYGNVLAAGTFNVTTSSQVLTTAAVAVMTQTGKADTTTGALTSGQTWGFCITNNSSATFYIRLVNAASSTNYYRQIPAGGFFEISAGPGVLNKIQIISSAGPVAGELTIFG